MQLEPRLGRRECLQPSHAAKECESTVEERQFESSIPYFSACNPQVCVWIQRGGEPNPGIETRRRYQRTVKSESGDFPPIVVLTTRNRLLNETSQRPHVEIRCHAASDRMATKNYKRKTLNVNVAAQESKFIIYE